MNPIQINPKLTTDEIKRLLKLCRISHSAQDASSLLEILIITAAQMPSARPILRQAKTPFSLKIQNIPTRARQVKNEIILATDLLQEPTNEIAISFIHELGHLNDKIAINNSNAFKQNDIACIDYDLPLTESEILNLSLLDEADKNALSHQLWIETDSPQILLIYQEQFKKNKETFLKTFSTWLPDNIDEWTKAEIQAERLERAHFYAAKKTQANYIKSFMKKPIDLRFFLPVAFQETITSSKLADLPHLEALPLNILSSYDEMISTARLFDEINTRIEYQEQAVFTLLAILKTTFFKEKGCKAPKILNSKKYKEIKSAFEDIPSRDKMILPFSTGALKPILMAFKQRYMGFLSVREMTFQTDKCFSYLPNNDVNHPPLLDLIETFNRLDLIKAHWNHQADSYFSPMCDELMLSLQKTSTQQLQKQKLNPSVFSNQQQNT